MKKIIYLSIMTILLNIQYCIAQGDIKNDEMLKKRYSEYQKFLSTISNQDFSSATSNTSIDLQGSSQAKFDISFTRKKDEDEIVKNNFSVKGTIGSNENLLSGKFLPKFEVGGGGYFLLNKKSGCWFREDDLATYFGKNPFDDNAAIKAIKAGGTLNDANGFPDNSKITPYLKANATINKYVLDRITINEANSIRLYWLNIGGTFKYNHYRLLDTLTSRDSISKEFNGDVFLQLNVFWMPHRQQGLIKKNNLIISGVLRYVLEFNGDNSDYLEKVTENKSTNSSFSTLSSSLIGDLKIGFKNTLSISAFLGLLIQNKMLLGINADAVYEGIKPKNETKFDNNTYLKLSFCLSSTSKENVYKTLQAVKVVPYIKIKNVFDNKPNKMEFGIATIFPINTFSNRD